MEKTIYVKYNRTRKNDFQTKTEIIDIDGKMIAKKTPLKKAGMAHIERMTENYSIYADYYNKVKLVNTYKQGNSVCFDYINGKSLSAYICDSIDDSERLFAKINECIAIISDINEKYTGEFELSKEFTDIFGKETGVEEYNGPSVSVCNIDSIFDNFIMVNDEVVAIDYEWLIKVNVPIQFVIFRALKMFYHNNYEVLGEKVSLEEYYLKFNVKNVELWKRMDEAFQQYVHGQNREAIYTDRYRKKINVLCNGNSIFDEIQNKDHHIDNITNENNVLKNAVSDMQNQIKELNSVVADQQETISVIRRELRNPLYALYRLCRKIAYKVLPHAVLRGLQILRNEGLYTLMYKLRQRRISAGNYEAWIKKIEAEHSEQMKNTVLEYKPLVSVLVPVYNVEPRLLKECLDSVVNQTYDNWQLCIADDCSTMPEVKKILEKYQDKPHIDVVYRKENGHISRATNSALEIAKGEYIALLDCDDLLAPNALFEMVYAVNQNRNAGFLYSDEDKIDDKSKHRFEPYFKPDWSPDTLMSLMYTCHFAMFKKSIVDSIGGFRVGYEGSQDYDLVLRVTEKVEYENIVHVPHILYHWRTRKESTSSDISAKPYIMEAARKAKEDALERRGLNGTLELVKETSQLRVNYIPQSDSKVSIIIPSKDNPDILERCIRSCREKTSFNNYEIIVVDNGSNDINRSRYEQICKIYSCRYLYEKMDFNFSKMCNKGAKAADGNYLLFLNDDIEIIEGKWLDRMLGQAELPHVGAVGAKLYYPDSTSIQHAGVINIMNGPSHALCGYDDNDLYYMGINKNDTDVLAVTAACLLVNKDKYNEVEGYNETLKVAYNDVDFCFKLVEAGYYNVIRNDAILYHYESFSRGIDTEDKEKTKRLIAERERLYSMHSRFACSENMDPFYHRHLVQNNVDYSFNMTNANNMNKIAVKERRLSDYNETDKICFNIDSKSISNNIAINGWAYLKGSKKNNRLKPTILFVKQDGKVYEYETVKVYRPDVCNTLPYRRLALIGFSLNTVVETELNDYRLAIAFGNKFTFI